MPNKSLHWILWNVDFHKTSKLNQYKYKQTEDSSNKLIAQIIDLVIKLVIELDLNKNTKSIQDSVSIYMICYFMIIQWLRIYTHTKNHKQLTSVPAMVKASPVESRIVLAVVATTFWDLLAWNSITFLLIKSTGHAKNNEILDISEHLFIIKCTIRSYYVLHTWCLPSV